MGKEERFPTTTDTHITMTTATKTETKEFILCYKVPCYTRVTVTRPANITEQELIDSITRDEMADCEEFGSWDDLKEAWRDQSVVEIMDSNYDTVF